jgi:hypothetical protein
MSSVYSVPLASYFQFTSQNRRPYLKTDMYLQ